MAAPLADQVVEMEQGSFGGAIRLFDQYGGGGFGASGTPLSMRLELRKRPERPSVYVPGFLTDKQMGDDPARYTRW